MKELWRKDLAAWADQQPVHTACALCDWTHEGTLAEGREAHTQHRVEAHGLKAKHRRIHSRRSPWAQSHKGLTDNIANARTTGAAGWASDDPEWRAA